MGTSQLPSFKVDTYWSDEDNVKCGTDTLNQFLIANFRRALNVVCFLPGNSTASEFYMPTFRNTLSVPSL